MSLFNVRGKKISALEARVAICTPTPDVVAAGFALDLAGLCGYTIKNFPKVELTVIQSSGFLLPGQRHKLVQEAQACKATHLLWIDSDMRFPKDALVQLLRWQTPIVGTSYVMRKPPFQQCAAQYPPVQHITIPPGSTGLLDVTYTGFGLLLTSMTVYGKMEKPYFQFGYSKTDDDYLGEDVYFFLKAKAAGFACNVDVGLSQQVGHVGSFTFHNEHSLASAEPEPQDAAPEGTACPA